MLNRSSQTKKNAGDTIGRETWETTRLPGAPPGASVDYARLPSGNSFQFRFFTGSSWQRQDLVSTDYFFDTILPGSHKKPYLLNFFHDLCLQCGDLEPIWEELRNVG